MDTIDITAPSDDIAGRHRIDQPRTIAELPTITPAPAERLAA
jgi:hypothetical protein